MYFRNIVPPVRILQEEPAEEEKEKEVAPAASQVAGVSTRPGKTTPLGKEKDPAGKGDTTGGRDSQLAPPGSRADKRPKSPKTISSSGGAKGSDKSKSAAGGEAGAAPAGEPERSPKYAKLTIFATASMILDCAGLIRFSSVDSVCFS